VPTTAIEVRLPHRAARPHVPSALINHECIGYRFPTAKTVYRWQFLAARSRILAYPPGSIVVNDHITMLHLPREASVSPTRPT